MSPTNHERDFKPISPQRRVRSASSIRRRNASRIQKYVLFITLLSVAILFYQQRLFLPSHDLGTEPVAVPHGDAIQKAPVTEAHPKPKHKSKPKPKHRAKPADKKAAKGAPVDQPPIPSPPPELQQHFDAKPQDMATNITEQKPREPTEPEQPAKPAEVEAKVGVELGVREDYEEVMVDEDKDAPEANFSLSNFNHADPCNSTLARMTAENITFLDNERTCGSVGLPIKMTPDLYKLPDPS